MLCATIPFKAQNMKELLKVIRTTAITFPVPLSENAKSMVKGLLTINPYDRLSIPEVLSHPWMKEDMEEDIADSDTWMGYKECLNAEANPLVPNINIVNLANVFFSDESKEKLAYSDYCYICNDLYTQHLGNLINRKF